MPNLSFYCNGPHKETVPTLCEGGQEKMIMLTLQLPSVYDGNP
jgi:hypothetical protein